MFNSTSCTRYRTDKCRIEQCLLNKEQVLVE